MRQLAFHLIASLAGVFSCAALAQAPVPPKPVEQQLDAVLVSGTQPGPGLWKVSKGDHVLWIIGTHTPLPIKMNWRAKNVESIISQSQEILGEPGVSIGPKQIGYLNMLLLIPGIYEVRKNPDGAMLSEIIPPDLYRRWVVLRDKYVDGYNSPDNDIERWRPAFAAYELYKGAIKQMGLSQSNAVWPVISAAAKKYDVKITSLTFAPEISDPRGAMRDFRSTRLDDLACFEKTIERVETDLPSMRRRANAWAVGDVNVLRKLPESDQGAACEAAFRNASFLKKLSAQDVEAQVDKLWMDGVEKALTNNKSTLTTLSIKRLIAPNGYLAKLKSRGFLVEEPASEEE